jgi:hypothetical protein
LSRSAAEWREILRVGAEAVVEALIVGLDASG